MKRRLRKKRRLGEFREDCFEVGFRIKPSLATSEVDSVTDDFIAMIEQNGLQFGGGGRYEWSGVVQGPWRKTVTAKDRDIVLAWLRQQAAIIECSAGPLKDAWHGYN